MANLAAQHRPQFSLTKVSSSSSERKFIVQLHYTAPLPSRGIQSDLCKVASIRAALTGLANRRGKNDPLRLYRSATDGRGTGVNCGPPR